MYRSVRRPVNDLLDATEEGVRSAARILRSGGVVAFPTETVYGLGADAENVAAIQRVFAIKGRPSRHPLIVHIASIEHLSQYARHVPAQAERLAETFWPGPLTLILSRGERVPLEVTGGQETVGLRVPGHALALRLLDELGRGVAAPSANRFGAVSPTTAAHVREDLGADLDGLLDGGPCEIGVESSIVDLSGGAPRLLRPGGISLESLEAALGRRFEHASISAVRAPGRLPSHYAPRAELLLVNPSELVERLAALEARGAKVGVLAPHGTPLPPLPSCVFLPETAAAYAHTLYAGLRELDARGVDVILAVAPDARGIGLAVRDRLERAAGPRGS